MTAARSPPWTLATTAVQNSSSSSSSNAPPVVVSSHFQPRPPEFVAIVLASTVGTRLFPITGDQFAAGAGAAGGPKHALPLVGVPVLWRLLQSLQEADFTQCVVTIAHDDEVTLPMLQRECMTVNEEKKEGDNNNGKSCCWEQTFTAAAIDSSAMASDDLPHSAMDEDGNSSRKRSIVQVVWKCLPSSQSRIYLPFEVTVVRLSDDCRGSIEALQEVESTDTVSPSSHVVVMPGDMIVFHTAHALRGLVHAHRQGQPRKSSNHYSSAALLPALSSSSRPSPTTTGEAVAAAAAAACTVLLADVSEQDEHGAPLKESAKAKKGGLARSEDEIEYTALAFSSNMTNSSISGYSSGAPPPRLVLKQSKLAVEEDVHLTGSTPKWMVPKARLRNDVTRLSTEWNDLHAYVLAPWVRRLVVVAATTTTSSSSSSSHNVTAPRRGRKLRSIQHDLIPLLVARQYRGIAATFGSNADEAQVAEALAATTATLLSKASAMATNDTDTVVSLTKEYSVLSHVVPGAAALRCASIPAYLYACKEWMRQATASEGEGAAEAPTLSSSTAFSLPAGATIKSKFQTVVLPDATMGDKCTFKSTVVGRNCQLGTKCRLNNVVLLDNVKLGDAVQLQNTVIGANAVVGDHCSLNDCQVAPGKHVAPYTKEKGQALVVEEGDDGDGRMPVVEE